MVKTYLIGNSVRFENYRAGISDVTAQQSQTTRIEDVTATGGAVVVIVAFR